MISIKDKDDCSGCYACVNICPNNCLSMVKDDEGFWYPRVDEDNCVGCNLCIKVCPIIKINVNRNDVKFIKQVYAARNINEKIRLDSSSGGIFTLLAEKIIDNNGIVIGAAFNEKFEVSHQLIEAKKDIAKFRGSKYVQSKIGDIYKKINSELDKNRLVLFTGTPCQIAGLKSYLNKEYDNLITQDIICHGVPSPGVWNKYIKYVSNQNKYEINSVNFRSKKENWRLFSLLFRFDNDKSLAKNIEEDFYLIAFQNNIDLRPSCYNCKFKGEDRKSDITLADFWGIENTNIKLDDNKGTSLVFINSVIGAKLFNEISKELDYIETDIKTATKYNKNYYISASKNCLRDNFLSAITENNFESIVRKYCNYSYVTQFQRKTKKHLKIVFGNLGIMKIIKRLKNN